MTRWRVKNSSTFVGHPDWVRPGEIYEGDEPNLQDPRGQMQQIQIRRPGRPHDVWWVTLKMLERVRDVPADSSF